MATSIQAQILEKLDEQGKDISEIKVQTALTGQSVTAMEPKLEKVHDIMFVSNGKKALVIRIDELENYVSCQKAVEKQKLLDDKASCVKAVEKKEDFRSKLKLNTLSAAITFGVVTILGWFLGYVYIVLPLLPHK